VEPVWNSQGHKHINGNAHRSYQVLLFFYVYGTTTLGATADHYEKQHRPQETCMFLEWTVFKSSASSISKSW